MSVIYAPVYNHPYGFSSLDELLDATGNSIMYYLDKVVRFNLFYRNYAKKHGIDATIKKILSECPRLRDYPEALSNLKESIQRDPISNIDLFYWPKEGCLEGANFTISLASLAKAVEVFADCSVYSNGYTRKTNFKSIAPEFHVAELWERVPCFDSFDYYYTRGGFKNYFISRKPFTDEIIRTLQELKESTNACKLTEQTPSSALPAVYFDEQSDLMLIGLPIPHN